MGDKTLVIPPDVGGRLEATLTISVDELVTGLSPSEGLKVALKWWGSDYTHYFKTDVSFFDEKSITFHVHTKSHLFEQYLKTGEIKFRLMEGKKLIGCATNCDIAHIISKKLFTTLLPVNDAHGYKIADLRVTFKYSLLEEDEKISKVGSNVTKFSMSKIVDDTNKIRSQIATSTLAECDSLLFMKNLPFDGFRTKSQEAKVVDFIQGKEMTKEEEEEALRALHCTSPLPSVLHLSRTSIETPRNESIYESDSGSDLEKMVKKTTSSALIERGIQFSKDSIVNAFTRTKNALNISIDSYRLGISKLILTNTGLRKIFNIPPYNFNGTYPTGTEFIFEYHPISSLGKSWFRPFILTAKQFDQNVVKFNEYMISKIKNSPDPWKLVNELCEGSEIKVYWKHSNEKLPSLLGATKYPSNSSTENFSKNLCLPLYTKYKLHVGNLLMKVELGSGLVFGKALVDAKSFEPREAPDDRITFRSMSEDSNRNKVPKILSKNAVSFVDQTKKMLETQYQLLDDQLSENLLTKLKTWKGKSRTKVKKKSDENDVLPPLDEPSTEESVCEPTTSNSSHASLGLDSVSNLKPYYHKTGKNCPPRQENVKKNRKKTKFDSAKLQTINVESGSSLQSSPERKVKKTSFSPKHTTLHVFKICVDEDFFHDSYNFFLEYRFLNVDDDFKVFWDPKIYRIDLGFPKNSQIHNLHLPNLTLTEAFKELDKDYLSIKFFARAITKRTFLISQLNIPLDKISFPEIRRRGSCFLEIPWKIDFSKSIPEGINVPKEMTLEIFYVKSPKDAQLELDHLEEKLSHNKFLRGVDSKKNWRDEFKEPAISRDPITGEPKSSRLDSKKDSKLRKLQEKCSFPFSNCNSDDFRPSSRPSFLSIAENECFPPEVDFVDLETTSVADENPFETSAELGKKQLWRNQDKNDVLVLSADIDEEIKMGSQLEQKLNDFPSKRDRYEVLYDEKEQKKTVFRPNFDEVIELSSEDEDEKMKAEEVGSSVINIEVEKELEQNKPLPKKVHVNIEVESALNLLVAVCKENGSEENPVLPTSRVELTTEVKGKTLTLKSPWVHDARAPIYNFSEDVDLPSEMFFKKNKKLEINVRAKVKEETYILKTLIDLTPISAGRMGLEGVYFLHLGTKAQGILLVNIRPLDNLEPLREAWENTFGMNPPSVENFDSELGQFEEHYMKNLTEMQSMIDEMGDMLEKDWKQPDPDTIKRIMSFKNSSPTCTPTYIQKYTETLDDNWTAESYLKTRIKPQIETSDDLNDVKKVDIDDNFSFDGEFYIETATNPPKDSLDAATNSIDKIIQELRKHHILD